MMTAEWETWLRNFDRRQAEFSLTARNQRKVLAAICIERGRPDLAEWLRLADWNGMDAR